jgi:hypothetical protein
MMSFGVHGENGGSNLIVNHYNILYIFVYKNSKKSPPPTMYGKVKCTIIPVLNQLSSMP